MGDVLWCRRLRFVEWWWFGLLGGAACVSNRDAWTDGWNVSRTLACTYVLLVILAILRVRRSCVVAGTEGVVVRPPGRTVRLRWAEVERFEHEDTGRDTGSRLRVVMATGERRRLASARLEGGFARKLVHDLNAELTGRAASATEDRGAIAGAGAG